MKLKRKGQQTMGMPFGMIFAIFLIIVFVVIAGIAVKSFLSIGDSARVGMFWNDLQKSVNSAAQVQEVGLDFEINLPSGVKEVCFANLSADITNHGSEYDAIERYDIYDANVFLVPPEKAKDLQWKLIERINISEITKRDNPYCVDVGANLKIKKNFYDRLVVIE